MMLWSSFLMPACTPMGAGPPPTRLPYDNKHEVGFHLGAEVGPEPEFLEEATWYRKSLGPHSELFFLAGGIFTGDFFVYTGMGYRRYFRAATANNEMEQPVDVAIEVAAGGIWGHVAVPISVQLGGKPMYFTTQPSFGYNALGSVHIPVGFSWQPRPRMQVDTSVGTRFLSPQGNAPLGYVNAGMTFPF